MGHNAVILLVAASACELGEAANENDVARLLVGAAWHHLNPHKSSEWESQTFVFRPDGTLEITTHHPHGPVVARDTWRVVRGGVRPMVAFGGRSRRLTARTRGDRSTALCLF
jgi:hypothetical protein